MFLQQSLESMWGFRAQCYKLFGISFSQTPLQQRAFWILRYSSLRLETNPKYFYIQLNNQNETILLPNNKITLGWDCVQRQVEATWLLFVVKETLVSKNLGF
jgi:hypothetical protein